MTFFKSIFDSDLSRYQIGSYQLMKVNNFIFDYVNLLHYKCHKINPNCGWSYIDSPDWIKTREQQNSHELKWW